MKHAVKYFFAIPGAVFILLATHKYGPGIDTDGVFYVLFGKTLAAHFNLMTFDSHFIGQWPPLYPIIISVLDWLHLDVQSAMRFINIGLWAGTLYFAYRMIEDRFAHRALYPLFAILLIFAFPVFTQYVKIESEPLFIFCTTAFLFCIIQLEKEWEPRYFVWLGISIVGMTLSRYAGAFCTIFGMGYFLIVNLKNPKKLKAIILTGFIACIPLALWLLRNYLVTDKLTGNVQMNSPLLLKGSLVSGLDTLSGWLFIKVAPLWIRICSLAVLFLILLVLIIVKRLKINSLSILPIFLGLYLFAFFLLAVFNFSYPVDDRYLSPVFIPFFICIFLVFDRTLSAIRFKKILYTLFSLIILSQVVTTSVYVYIRFCTGGGGFNTIAWQTSPLSLRLRSNPLPGKVYTNQMGPCQYFNNGYAYNILNKNRLSDYFKNLGQGYIVMYDDADRNISAFNALGSQSVNSSVRQTLANALPVTELYDGQNEAQFLAHLSSDYHFIISAPEVFQDGRIYKIAPINH